MISLSHFQVFLLLRVVFKIHPASSQNRTDSIRHVTETNTTLVYISTRAHILRVLLTYRCNMVKGRNNEIMMRETR